MKATVCKWSLSEVIMAILLLLSFMFATVMKRVEWQQSTHFDIPDEPDKKRDKSDI